MTVGWTIMTGNIAIMTGNIAIMTGHIAIMTGHMAGVLKTEPFTMKLPRGIRCGRDTLNDPPGRSLNMHAPKWGTLIIEERPKDSTALILEEFQTAPGGIKALTFEALDWLAQ